MDDILSIAIPNSVENLQLPNPELKQFYEDLANRIIYLDYEVDVCSLELMKYIIKFNREDTVNGVPIAERKPIKLIINSCGGDLSVNNTLINTIELSKTPVYGYNIGEAASAACFIFMSCHKRFVLPSANFVVHKGSAQFSGCYEDVVAAVVNYQSKIDELGNFIMAHTKIPQNVFEENFGSDWYMNAAEAVEYGLADEVITDISVLF